MTRHALSVLAATALLMAGCGLSPVNARFAPARGAAGYAAADAPPAPTTWTGNWVTGDGDDTQPAGPMLSCMSHWHLSQDGDQFVLDGDHNPDGGEMPNYLQFESATGSLKDGELTLTGEIDYSPTGPNLGLPKPQPLTYVLKLDPAKGHITGTRNGKPFWAAPFKASQSAACPQLP